eukprot:406929-Pyramimonas_sp.AAC.1
MSSVWTAARMRQSRAHSSLRRIMPMGSVLFLPGRILRPGQPTKCPSEMKELTVSRTIANILMGRRPSCMCCTEANQFPSTMLVTMGGTSCSISPLQLYSIGIIRVWAYAFVFDNTLSCNRPSLHPVQQHIY